MVDEVSVFGRQSVDRETIPAQVLAGDELRRLGSHSVADAIRYFSGVQIKDYGGIGGLKTVNIRSMGSQHVGVFYDGIQIGNAQNGTVDLGKFSLDNMEAISLYNGQKSDIFQSARDFASASALYMVSRKPIFGRDKKHNLNVKFRTGSFDVVNPSVLWEARLNLSLDAVETLDIAHLVTVGGNANITATPSNVMESVDLKRLETVGGNLAIVQWPAATKMDLSALKSVGGMADLRNWPKITTISLPALETAGGIMLNHMVAATSLDMPKLKTLTDNASFTLPAFTNFFLNSVEEIAGNLTLSLSRSSGATFSNLKSVGGNLQIPSSAANLVAPYFPALKSIGGDLQIESKAVTDLTGFAALEEIGARLYLYNATNLASISGLASLKKIGTSLYLYSTENLNELDTRGIEISRIDVYSNACKNGLTITGDEIFGGILNFGYLPAGLNPPVVKGIKKCGGLIVSVGSDYKGNIEISGVEEVAGTIDFKSSNSVRVISLPDLKKAGTIVFQYNYGITNLLLPELVEITGDFTYPVVYSNYYGGPLAEVRLPKLTTVGGSFSMTGITAQQTITGIDMPLLNSVGGTLTLSGTGNTNFTDVGNFSNLTSAKGVSVSGFTNLVDFTGFAGVIPALDATSWKITNCGYNPTWQNMSDGDHTRP
jgi:hypothetical protein